MGGEVAPNKNEGKLWKKSVWEEGFNTMKRDKKKEKIDKTKKEEYKFCK